MKSQAKQRPTEEKLKKACIFLLVVVSSVNFSLAFDSNIKKCKNSYREGYKKLFLIFTMLVSLICCLEATVFHILRPFFMLRCFCYFHNFFFPFHFFIREIKNSPLLTISNFSKHKKNCKKKPEKNERSDNNDKKRMQQRKFIAEYSFYSIQFRWNVTNAGQQKRKKNWIH